MRTNPVGVCTLALLPFTCSCGSQHTDSVCDPGETQPCFCAGGLTGAQSCNEDGTGWSACDCGAADTGTDGEAVDTVTDTDADPSTDLVTDDGAATDPPPDPGVDAPDAPDTVTGGIVGDPCTSDTDCSGVPVRPTCLTDLMGYISFPGGYCSGDCVSDTDCGPGAECVTVVTISYCLKTCTMESECRVSEGYVCDLLPYLDIGPYCFPDLGMPDPTPDASTD